MQIAANESMWPVLGGGEVDENFYRDGGDADHAGRARPGGYVIWIALRAVLGSAVFLLVAALLGAVPSAWGVLAIPASALCAAAFCRAAHRVLRRARRATSPSR